MDPENQILALRQFANASGWTITRTYTDRETGSKLRRPALESMLAGADRREFDVLLFYSLDRLTRTGILDTLAILDTLDQAKILFHSLTEELFRNYGPIGKFFISMKATFAQIEREAISDRTKAGLARARAQGKILGRPKTIANRDRINEQRSQGIAIPEIARDHGCSESTIRRLCRLARPSQALTQSPGRHPEP